MKKIFQNQKNLLKVSFKLTPDAFNYVDVYGETKRHNGDTVVILFNVSTGKRSKASGGIHQ